MNKHNYQQVLDRAAKSAFDRVSSASGTETDPDLALYNKLTPQDFSNLMREYGEQGVIDYIRAMETKRMMGGKHG